MVKKKKETHDSFYFFFKFIPFLLTICSFISGILVTIVSSSFWISKNVATVPYVDSKHEEALKFADKVASDHAEMVKKDMLAEIRAQGSDIKAMATKEDILLDSVRTIQNRMFEERKK